MDRTGNCLQITRPNSLRHLRVDECRWKKTDHVQQSVAEERADAEDWAFLKENDEQFQPASFPGLFRGKEQERRRQNFSTN